MNYIVYNSCLKESTHDIIYIKTTYIRRKDVLMMILTTIINNTITNL